MQQNETMLRQRVSYEDAKNFWVDSMQILHSLEILWYQMLLLSTIPVQFV